ncbi:hypothetical protein, partial [Nonomuraea sp. NPDC050691]|uniref:hypothetical protein n=1 Tax=Nonomuraea sp. NPDC050691 TaxID=3155661 RepID=UPI0033C95948
NATDMNIEAQFPWWDQVVLAGAHMTAHSATVPGLGSPGGRRPPRLARRPPYPRLALIALPRPRAAASIHG